MGKVISEVGNGYNRLVVLSRGENSWNNEAQFWCQCSCGERVLVRGSRLRTGNTQSCGCLQRDMMRERHPVIDLTGKRFGRWLVKGRAGRAKDNHVTWHCVCDCGTEREVGGTRLRSGGSKSCGCLQRDIARETAHFMDLTGKRFGRWLVKSRAENGEGRVTRWHCVCDCGTEKVVIGSSLKNGRSKSCGCWQREIAGEICKSRILPAGVAAFNGLFGHYQRQAKARGYTWELTREQFRELTQRSCFFCSEPPSNVQNGTVRGGSYIYSGIDRLNNDQGYNILNCRACCARCNMAKAAMSVDEFLAWVERVYNHSIANGNGPDETHTVKTRSVLPFTRELPIEGQVVTGGLAE